MTTPRHTVMTLNQPDEEHLTILIDGEEVGSFDHDSHGWAGIEAGANLAMSIAKKLGLEIEETNE
jgi:hypothetical protein